MAFFQYAFQFYENMLFKYSLTKFILYKIAFFIFTLKFFALIKSDFCSWLNCEAIFFMGFVGLQFPLYFFSVQLNISLI